MKWANFILQDILVKTRPCKYHTDELCKDLISSPDKPNSQCDICYKEWLAK